MKYYAHVQNYVDCSPDESLNKVFDDFPEECDPDLFENRTVEGWSFVQGTPAPNNAGN